MTLLAAMSSGSFCASETPVEIIRHNAAPKPCRRLPDMPLLPFAAIAFGPLLKSCFRGERSKFRTAACATDRAARPAAQAPPRTEFVRSAESILLVRRALEHMLQSQPA